MKSNVTKLYDRTLISVPPEMIQWHVDADAIDEQLHTLACSHASEFHPDTVQKGDSVRLSCPEHTDVLLFPGLALPGVEKAEEDVIGLHVGDGLTASINGDTQTMTVCEIRRRVPASIDDALIQAEHIEGVATLEDYRRWYQAKEEEQNKSDAVRNIAFFLFEEIRERSEYALDQEEMNKWADKQARQYLDECIAMGIDPHIPDEGFELLTDEQAVEKFKAQFLPEFRSILVGQELCEQGGVSLTWEDLRSEFEQMMPTDQEDITDEEREQAKAMFMESAPVAKALDMLIEEAREYVEDWIWQL